MKDNIEEYLVDFKLEEISYSKKMTNFIYRNQEILLNKGQRKLKGKTLTLEKIFVTHKTYKDWFPNIQRTLKSNKKKINKTKNN